MSERIACMSMDIEPDLRDPSRQIRLLDDDARMQALVDVLTAERVPLTSFTVMVHARRHADRLAALAARVTMEYAVHSFSHDTAQPASETEVRSAKEAYQDLWGAPPLGYRSPNCLIDERGVDTLVRHGFLYDSSIVPSVRADGYAYNNLRFGRDPFLFAGPSGSILELPVACLGGIRLPLIFSYVKLLGLQTYQAALSVFPLPDIVVTYLHPYDLYVEEVVNHVTGWKRLAHRRNSRNALVLLSQLIRTLKGRGYRFALMRDVAGLMRDRKLRTVPLAPTG